MLVSRSCNPVTGGIRAFVNAFERVFGRGAQRAGQGAGWWNSRLRNSPGAGRTGSGRWALKGAVLGWTSADTAGVPGAKDKVCRSRTRVSAGFGAGGKTLWRSTLFADETVPGAAGPFAGRTVEDVSRRMLGTLEQWPLDEVG